MLPSNAEQFQLAIEIVVNLRAYELESVLQFNSHTELQEVSKEHSIGKLIYWCTLLLDSAQLGAISGKQRGWASFASVAFVWSTPIEVRNDHRPWPTLQPFHYCRSKSLGGSVEVLIH